MAGTFNTETVVVGGGPAGLIAAGLLAVSGVPVALVAPPPPPDTRTTALMQSSLDILARLGLWPLLAAQSGALKKLRLVDASGSLIRAPETLFDSAELGLPAFGHNIENTHLLAALRQSVEQHADIRIFTSPVISVRPGPDAVTITLESGEEISARLAVGADGRNSICRAAAGIEAKTHDYEQSALTFNIAHTRPHNFISTEFHRRGGPLTLVPLPDNRSSVVLVNTPDETARLSSLDNSQLGRELEDFTHGLLGRITVGKARGARLLSSLTVEIFGSKRIALVGESGHVLPPIGAQGLNLGIRDAAAIAALVADALETGKDPGSDALLAAYTHDRHADAKPRHIAIDLLNRSLLSDFLPLDAGRALGLWALASLPPLRREVMRRGLALV